jgi:hypothetical protein
MVGLIKNI